MRNLYPEVLIFLFSVSLLSNVVNGTTGTTSPLSFSLGFSNITITVVETETPFETGGTHISLYNNLIALNNTKGLFNGGYYDIQTGIFHRIPNLSFLKTQ